MLALGFLSDTLSLLQQLIYHDRLIRIEARDANTQR